MEQQSLVQVLTLLAQGLGIGGILSFLFEHFAFLQNLSSNTKWWLVLALSVGLPLVAQLIVQFVPPEALVAVEPFWKSVAAGFTVWLGSQVIHVSMNKRS